MCRRLVPIITAFALAGVSPSATAQALESFGVVQIQNGRGGLHGYERRQRRSGYQEPAYARGYSDGVRQGVDDRRDRDRYDPVGHGDYRDGDQGYYRSYGSRNAYRNNYRAGYREGYEVGYRGRAGTGR